MKVRIPGLLPLFPPFSLSKSVAEMASSKGEVRIGEVAEDLADKLGLSQEERSELLPSGKYPLKVQQALPEPASASGAGGVFPLELRRHRASKRSSLVQSL